MTKKLIALFLSLCITASVTGSAFAAEANAGQDYKITDSTTDVVPIYGYIGFDTSEIDPDDKETEIYVEVPVKLLFAAFEFDAGTVTSPKYTITNLSETSDIKVEIESFEQHDEAITPLGSKLSLKLLTPENEDIAELLPASFPKTLAASLSKYVEGDDSNQLTFSVGGTWIGTFDVDLQPVFDLTLKFSGV